MTMIIQLLLLAICAYCEHKEFLHQTIYTNTFQYFEGQRILQSIPKEINS